MFARDHRNSPRSAFVARDDRSETRDRPMYRHFRISLLPKLARSGRL